MKKVKLLSLIIMLGGMLSCQCTQEKKESLHYAKAPWQEVAAFAEANLPKKGVLVQQSDGYAYIKVDDDYVHQLYPKLHADKGFKKPPYFRRKDSVGAHISVIYKDEKVKLQEAGQIFYFTVRDIITVHPKKDTSYIILRVDAPELEKLRGRYGLSPKLHGHDFHISIAKKDRH